MDGKQRIVKEEEMKRTLYVSDLDGTLLNRQSVLSETTIATLNRILQEKKALFTIATARTPATVVDLMKEVKCSLPFVLMAGAVLWNDSKQNYERVRAIPSATVDKLLEIYGHYTIRPFIYRRHGNCLFVYHTFELTESERQFIEPRIQSPFKRLVTTESLTAQDPDDSVLVYSMGSYATLLNIANEIRASQLPCTLSCYQDIFDCSQGILEIYAPKTTKAEAIDYLAKQCHAERVVVFGDNLNDLPMMEIADHSVAVGNAFKEVKEQANEIIGCNDEDAVAKWIEQDCQ